MALFVHPYGCRTELFILKQKSDSMDIYLIILLIVGMSVGFVIPKFAERLSRYKCWKKSMELESDSRYTSTILRLRLGALNGAGWLVFGSIAENLWVAALISLIFSVAVLTAIIDIRIRLVPNELVVLLLVLGASFQAVQFGLTGFLTSLLCMLIMMVLFTTVAGLIGFSKVGAGDVKLAGTMGISLGYPGVIAGLIVMGAGFAIFALVGMTAKKLTMKTMVPFAPFMMTGLIFALMYIAS